MPEAWSYYEVSLIVHDYFNMLIAQFSGEEFNKTQHRRKLKPLLRNRSDGSIEFKHQNISAILASLGLPYLIGYRPRYNYQKTLADHVLDYLINNNEFERYFERFSDKIVTPTELDFQSPKFIVNPPAIRKIEEPEVLFDRRPVKVNYILKEQNNQILGNSGEELVIRYEKWRLTNNGYASLADKIEWISRDQGDGAGFDILSRNNDGSDRYIEVKTTKLSKEAPFYFSSSELKFSLMHKERYHLYRLFNFDKSPGMFTKRGDFNSICRSEPVVYKGYF